MSTDGRTRIVHLLGWYLPDSVGGTELYVHQLARDLRAAGWDATVAAPHAGADARRYEVDEVPVFRYPVKERPTTDEVRSRRPHERFDVFADWLVAQRPDVLHVHAVTRGAGYHHARLARALNVPVILTAHVPGLTCRRGTLLRWGRVPCDGTMRERRCAACWLTSRGIPRSLAWPLVALPPLNVDPPRPAGLRMLASALRARADTRHWHAQAGALTALAARVVVVSRWLHQVLERNGVPAEKLVLSPHGLPPGYPRRSRSAAAKGPLQIGYVGRLDPVKGVHVLVRAFRRLPVGVAARLHVYGPTRSEEERSYLRRLQRDAAGDRRIRFWGEVARERRHEVFEQLHALAVPSLWLESGPLVVLEAFAAGIPVLGSNAGGIAELVEDGVSGVLVEPGNVAAWTRALARLYRRLVDERRGFTTPAVRDATHVTTEMLDVYQAVLTGAGHRAENWTGIAVAQATPSLDTP